MGAHACDSITLEAEEEGGRAQARGWRGGSADQDLLSKCEDPNSTLSTYRV